MLEASGTFAEGAHFFVKSGKILACHVSRLVVCRVPFAEMTPRETL